jgi:hypothetical protein
MRDERMRQNLCRATEVFAQQVDIGRKSSYQTTLARSAQPPMKGHTKVQVACVEWGSA